MARTARLKATARRVAGPLDQRIAVVTGAAAGLGRAIAQRLARDGAEVFVSDIDGDGARSVAQQIVDAGGRAHAQRADVANVRSVAALFDAVAAVGAVHIVINNAGIMQPTALDEAAFDRVMAVNLSGPRHALKHALPVMVAAGRGAIVNISSNLALAPWVGQPLYSSTKAGLIGLTTSVARDVARHGVRVNAICPGAFATPMLSDTAGTVDAAARVFAHLCPSGRMGQPEELAGAVAWLVSDEAAYVSGASLVVDGGTTAW